MSRHPELYQWQATLAGRFPGLSPTFVGLLAWWSVGMLLARHCGLTTVATYLAPLLGLRFNTVRQRLREFYQEAAAKAGAQRGLKRRDFDVTACFAPLLAWVLSFWTDQRLALALDVTNLGDRLHILCVSVLYGGIGLPVAWKVLPGNQKGAWHPHWCALLRGLHAALGHDWQVLVLSDRGLESARLFEEIVGLKWHPLMRVKAGGKFRPHGWVHWYPLGAFAPRVGCRFASAGQAYKGDPLGGVLLACWEEGYAEPWLLLTDLPPAAAHPCWYAFRAWIEQGFKVIKSTGLNWKQTRMTAPARVERQWLALAVTLLWLVAVGAEVEHTEAIETIGRLPAGSAPPERERLQRLSERGRAALLAVLVQGQPLPRGKLPKETWPEPWHDIPTVTEINFVSDQTYP